MLKRHVRCYRLDKECRPSAGVRKPKLLSKKAQLEQQVDDLTSQLNASQTSSRSSGHSTATPTPVNGDREPPAFSTPTSHNHTSSTAATFTVPSLQPQQDTKIQESVRSVLDAKEEESLLCSFREEKLPFFPLTAIPPVDAKSILHFKQQSPFLWRCITAIETKERAHQSDLVIGVRREAAERLLVDCRKNLDLLQGLLVYLAWMTYQTQPQKSSFCVYTQLAIALVVELGLNKAPPPRGDHSNANDSEGVTPVVLQLRPPSSPTRTMDERRTVLCCFLLSS